MSYLIQSRRLCKRLGEKNLLSDVEVHVPQQSINHTDAPGAESVETHQRGGGAVRRTAAAGGLRAAGAHGQHY